ncbi:sugar ABC transporter substrate-binding protein [Pelagibacteraceae bacterium]|nr:sugar ABC transporter substrate-binding protein [Pelagibacteraceae bacterium]
MKFFISLITTSLLFFSGSLLAGSHAKTIMLSTKGPGAGNPFWASVEAGAKDAAEELGVNLIILSPPQESDVMAQVAQIEDQIAKGVDGIAIAPTDPNAVAPILDDAIASGVPVVYIDTNGINEGVTFIGTNNINGAALAAQYICDNVPSGSDVAILQGMITQTTGQHRAEGSHKGLEACGLNIVAELPANWDTAQGMSVTEDILTGNPNLKAIFASNDNMGLGAIQALKKC